MARKSTKRIKPKRMRRLLLVTLICLAVHSYLIYEWEENPLFVSAKEEEDILKSEVKKLKDPVYVAKYAREKFFYSGDNEYIIRMK